MLGQDQRQVNQEWPEKMGRRKLYWTKSRLFAILFSLIARPHARRGTREA
jgi:hypothetical protein